MQKTILKKKLFPLGDLIGAFGDVGTFVPLFSSLVLVVGLNPFPTLFCAGFLYVAAAIFFKVPIPVQPLKTMAALVIASQFPLPVVKAAGLLMGFVLILVSLTRGIEWAQFLFPPVIIKGVQFGAGLILIKTGITMFFSFTMEVPSVLRADYFPQGEDFLKAFFALVLPQLPLTLGNSLFATTDLSKEYYGEKAHRVSVRNLGLSLGWANIITGFLGGFPLCHGSGGLTAHHRFGARSYKSTFFSGILFLFLAFFSLKYGIEYLKHIPTWFLGGMVIYIGIYHALLLKSLKAKKELAVLMGVLGLWSGNLALSLLIGIFVLLMSQIYSKYFSVA
ncbi:MAG: putative sulfate/molybdate transporter [Elusimicrobiota bacterium]